MIAISTQRIGSSNWTTAAFVTNEPWAKESTYDRNPVGHKDWYPIHAEELTAERGGDPVVGSWNQRKFRGVQRVERAGSASTAVSGTGSPRHCMAESPGESGRHRRCSSGKLRRLA